MKKNNDQFYFEALTHCAGFGLEAARHLQSILRDFHPETLETEMKVIHKIENKADECKHAMIERLSHEFMPPIEREDILELSHQIDNIVDCIDEVVQRVYMYHVESIRAEAAQFTDLIVRACTEVVAAMEDFPSFRKKEKELYAHIVMANTIEADGDTLFIHTMRTLYGEEKDTIALCAWDHIYDSMEGCLDACEKVCDTLERVIMKNA